MATASKAKSKKGGSQLDQRAKIKLIAASVLLVLALGWILIWAIGPGGAAPSEELSQEEVQQLHEERQQEIKKVQEELQEKYGGRTPPAPAGS